MKPKMLRKEKLWSQEELYGKHIESGTERQVSWLKMLGNQLFNLYKNNLILL